MSLSQRVQNALPALYVSYALIGALILLWKLPAFMGPDEPNHFKRADQVARGAFLADRIGARPDRSSGGEVDVNIDQVATVFAPLQFHPDVKLRQIDVASAQKVMWSNKLSAQSFENTAIYPPLFYGPASLGILISRSMGASILSGVLLARCLGAVAAIAVGYCALRLAGPATVYLFTVLLFPMCLGQDATVTQDGLLLATCALAAALLVRPAAESRPANFGECWGLAICLGLVGMAKPPYILFCLLPLVFGQSLGKRRWGVAGLGAGLGIGWLALCLALVATPMRRPGLILDPGAQLHLLMTHPGEAISVVAATLKRSGGELYAQFIGVLGWLDTVFPKLYYAAAFLVLGFAIWTLFPGRTELKRARLWSGLLVLGAVKLAVFLAIYVTYTPLGSSVVEGVQGRYFLPVALFLPAALSRTDLNKTRLASFGALLLAAFPLATLAVLVRVLTARYA